MRKKIPVTAVSAALILSTSVSAYAADSDMNNINNSNSTSVVSEIESNADDNSIEESIISNAADADSEENNAEINNDAEEKSVSSEADDSDEQSGNPYQVIIDGKKYIVVKKGDTEIHLTGWYEMAPYGKLYLNPDDDGAAVTGVYSIEEDGQTNTYIFDSNGIAITTSGTPEIDEKKYWIKADGTLGNGWLYLGNWKMYFDPESYTAYTVDNGVADIDGHKYLFNSDGVMQTYAGTTVVNGAKYWFSDEGYLKSGWLQLGSWKMYFDPETYQAATGIKVIDGKTYLFDANGVLKESGTVNFDGKKYYIKSDNTLGSGWLQLGSWKMYFDPETYQAATGIKEIDGKYYLFDSNGVMYTSGTPVYDGKKYFVQSDNTLGKGWLQLGSWKFHFNEDTFAADTGICNINGKTYMFNELGVMYFAPNATPMINGAKYWFGADSSLRAGWLNMSGWSMYFDPETYQAATGVKNVDGKKLIFDKNGLLISGTGIFISNGNKYCIDKDGNAVTGWYQLGDWKLYFDPDTGIAATGVKSVEGKKLIFDSNGVNISGNGLFVSNGKKYYINNGNAVTGWVTIGNWTMYFNPSTGEAATGLQTIDGKTYYFNKDGIRTSGREYINGVTYYFNSDGTLIKNQWVTFNGEKIYVNGNGIGLTDRSDEYPGPYYITVDRTNCVITVYAKDSSGNYSIPVRAMTCSVGLPGTPTYAGTYSVGAKYVLKELMGPSYGKYATAVAGQSGVYFHSVATSSASNPTYSVPAGEYNKLGTPASHGCIRVCVRDAKWIYDNCAYGTTIYIGDNLSMPLGKPATVLISSSVDPTDPEA